MFDICLSVGCHSAPNLENWTQYGLTEPDKIRQITSTRPLLLGLDLELSTAQEILLVLFEHYASGVVVPSKYREPKFPLELARPIAERELIARMAKHPGLSFGPITFNPLYTGLTTWGFSVACEEWIEAGSIPGAIIVFIDKDDGHIHQNEDHQYFRSLQPKRRR